ncbi:flagellin [Janthinobacterium sp. 78]|uniref:flagellin n=1 Tax=Janthinobacterium sp. 78 TaxID=2135631 RepID=UPI00325FB4CA
MTAKASASQISQASASSNSAAVISATDITDLGTAQTNYNTALGLSNAAPTNATLAADTNAKANLLAAADVKSKASTAAAAAALNYSNAASLSSVDGKFAKALNFQIGASTTETMGLDLTGQLTGMHAALTNATKEYNSFGAAIAGGGAELTTAGSASATIDKLQAAIDAVGTTRSALGAAGNRLDHVATNLANVSTNTAGATGRIMDTDFATESSNMTASQMLLQAGTAMLKQSNSMSSMVMSLLQ